MLTAVNMGQAPLGLGVAAAVTGCVHQGPGTAAGTPLWTFPALSLLPDSTLHLCRIHGKVSVALPSCTRMWVGKMPAPPAQRACLRAELAQDGEVAQGPEGHVKAWPSPNTYKSEAHASQVSQSSVYFGDSCRAAQDRGRQVWSCPQGERVSDQGPHTRSQGWSPGSLSPRQHPSGVELASGRPFSTGFFWAGRGGHTPRHGCRHGEAEASGWGSPWGLRCPRDHWGGAGGRPASQGGFTRGTEVSYEAVQGKGTHLSPQDQTEGGCCSPGGRAGVRPPGDVALTSAAAAAQVAGRTPCRRRW